MAWTERLLNVFRRTRVAAEIDDELHFHLDQRTRENVAAGMTPDEARRDALRRLGNIPLTKEQVRDVDTLRWLDELRQDLRYGLRTLRRSPGFTVVAVLTLALGIGASTAMFSVVNALMLRDLPVRDPTELVMFRQETGQPTPEYIFGYGLFTKCRELTDVFTDVAAVGLIDRSNVAFDEADSRTGIADARQMRVALVSGSYFSMLGVAASQGRVLSPDDDRVPGGHPMVVVSDDFWNRRLNGASNVVGRHLTLNGFAFTIVGVAPRGFSGDWIGRPADLWIPMMMQSEVMPEMPGALTRGNGFLRILARLKPGNSVQRAQARVQTVYQRDVEEGFGPSLKPAQRDYLARARLTLVFASHGYSPQRESFAWTLGMLDVVVGVVLLIACTNVANLLLARAASRRREIAVRLAIGAGRTRIERQLLTESVLLASLGGALGFLFAMWAAKGLVSSVATGPVQMDSRLPSPWLSFDVQPDAYAFVFTAVVCLVTVVIFGFTPARRGSNVALSSTLTARGFGFSNTAGRFALHKMLVALQVTLTLPLLITAGLFVRSLHTLESQDLGINSQHLLLVWTAPGQTGRQGPALITLVRGLQERLSTVPGVISTGMSNHGLLEGSDGGSRSEMMPVEGHQSRPGLTLMGVAVSPRFFETAGMPLLAGRDFNERDSATAPRVAILNETAARFLFEKENPIGRHIRTGADREEIVGVVKDAKHGTPRDARGIEYRPYGQNAGLMRTMSIAVRTAGAPTSVAARVRRELHDFDAGLPVLGINTVAEQLDDVLVEERLIARLASVFGGLALFLASLGLYGVISYATSRRTNEIGVRMALGARSRDVLKMVFLEGVLVVVAGIAVGVPVAFGVSRLVASRLFRISPTDPIAITSAALLMIAVAGVAGVIPARRASRADPMNALRTE